LDKNGIQRYFEKIQLLTNQVILDQNDLLLTISNCMVNTVQQHKRIFLFGTGHSHMMVEEGFYRAGGLTAVVPVFSAALMLHENPIMSSTLERTPGLAAPLLAFHQPQPGEMIFIYSNSGANQLPVEMALLAKEKGLTVIAVLSKKYAEKAPTNTIGKKLYEVADFVLDNGGEPGDALISLTEQPWQVGPSSTVVNAIIWNALITETALQLEKILHEDVPVLASLNMPGAAEHNEKLFSSWKDVNPYFGYGD
jgi:uncharacterized phosphosugar-binding protein